MLVKLVIFAFLINYTKAGWFGSSNTQTGIINSVVEKHLETSPVQEQIKAHVQHLVSILFEIKSILQSILVMFMILLVFMLCTKLWEAYTIRIRKAKLSVNAI